MRIPDQPATPVELVNPTLTSSTTGWTVFDVAGFYDDPDATNTLTPTASGGHLVATNLTPGYFETLLWNDDPLETGVTYDISFKYRRNGAGSLWVNPLGDFNDSPLPDAGIGVWETYTGSFSTGNGQHKFFVLFAGDADGVSSPTSVDYTLTDFAVEKVAIPGFEALRLEVEDEATGLTNLIQNPNGELGGYGWVTPVPGSVLVGEPSPSTDFQQGLRYTTAADPGGNYFYSEPIALTAGHYVNAMWRANYVPSSGGFYRVRMDWLDANQNQSGQSAWFDFAEAYAEGAFTAPIVIPAGTVYGRIRFEVGSGGVDGVTETYPNVNAGSNFSVVGVTVASAPTSGEVADVHFLVPVEYLDILGPTHDIKIDREELNLGTLTATILDSTLDPSQGGLIRPGKRVRMVSWNTDSGAFEAIFSGKIQNAKVSYHLKDPSIPDVKRARIELIAVDAAQTLAQASRPEGVASVDDLPYVLEGAGVPWNVNGSGNQVSAATVVARNESATAIDQIAITRDSVHGYAWVDRYGVAQVWDAALMDSTSALLNESSYSDIDVDYDTDRCINAVTVNFLRYNPITGDTEEVAYGPYADTDSIALWGMHSATFTVQGLVEDEPTIAAYAQSILDANKTPTVRVNSMTLPIRTEADLTTDKGLLDLYALANIVLASKGINDFSRVTGISHSITPDKWLVTLSFATEGGVAMPQVTPPVQSTSTIGSGAAPTPVGGVSIYVGTTPPLGWLLCDGSSRLVADFPALHGVIGYVFGGSGDSFNLPDMRDRFPNGAGTARPLGDMGGADTVTMPDHRHSIPGQSGTGYAEVAQGAINVVPYGQYNGHNHGGQTGLVVGTNPPIANVPKYVAVNYIIKV